MMEQAETCILILSRTIDLPFTIRNFDFKQYQFAAFVKCNNQLATIVQTNITPGCMQFVVLICRAYRDSTFVSRSYFFQVLCIWFT